MAGSGNVSFAAAQNSPAAGAIQAVATDPNNANIIYAGTGSFDSSLTAPDSRAAVGLLMGTVAADGSVSWQVIGRPKLDGHRITGIVANGNTIVVSADTDGPAGSGDGKFLFRSTNGGASFTPITKDTANALLGPVTDIVIVPSSPNTMFIGVRGLGVYQSTNSGAAWTKVNANPAGIPGGLEFTDNSDVDGDGNLDEIGDDIQRSSGIRLAVYDDGTGVQALYAALVGPTNVVAAAANATTLTGTAFTAGAGTGAYIFRSAVAPGAPIIWLPLAEPTSVDQFWTDQPTVLVPPPPHGDGVVQPAEVTPQFNPVNPSGQATGNAAFHFSMVADPADAFVVYVAGDTQPANGPQFSFARNAVGIGYLARIFRGDASKPTGSQWVQIVGNDNATTASVVEGAGGTSPHGDSRSMVFDKNKNLLEVDDGGISRLTITRPVNLGARGIGTWQSLTPANAPPTPAANHSLGITVLYSMAL